MTRELARQEDRPRDIIIRLTGSQKSQREYHQDEIIRLNAEMEELTRRYEAKIEGITLRLAQSEAQNEPLKIFRDYLSLDCPRELSRRTTILECAGHRKRRKCIKINCVERTMLLVSLR